VGADQTGQGQQLTAVSSVTSLAAIFLRDRLAVRFHFFRDLTALGVGAKAPLWIQILSPSSMPNSCLLAGCRIVLTVKGAGVFAFGVVEQPMLPHSTRISWPITKFVHFTGFLVQWKMAGFADDQGSA
jgi:hypothetical protein